MKWGGYSDKAAEKVTKFVGKLVGPRGLYILALVAAFVLLTGATRKWTGW